MRGHKLWLQALAIIIVGSWRLASAPTVAAEPLDACGRPVCTGGCDGEFECAECPGWTCIGYGHWPCAFSYLVYCHDIK